MKALNALRQKKKTPSDEIREVLKNWTERTPTGNKEPGTAWAGMEKKNLVQHHARKGNRYGGWEGEGTSKLGEKNHSSFWP